MLNLKKLTIMGCLLFTLTLAGCGQEPHGSEQPDTSTIDTTNSPSTTEEDVPRHEDGRALVTLSALQVDSTMEEAVISFNNSNTEYYVQILEKDSDQSFSDYYERERIELSLGKGPDIFCNTLMSSFTTYIEKGIIEDLAPYIERDLNPEDYLASSLYAYAQDGKVYAIESSFTIVTQVGSAEVFGDRTSLSFEDLQTLMLENPQITIYESLALEPGEFLRLYLSQGNPTYTDYETLKQVIAFDKTYSGQLPADVMAVPGENVMVIREYIDDALDLADLEAAYGRDLNIIGFVNDKGCGNTHESFGWSINAASKQKEGAWAFLRYLLSEDYQRTYTTDFSPLKSIFEEQLQYYTEPVTFTVFLEEVGEEVTITRKHTLPRASSMVYGQTVEIDSLSTEQIEKVRQLVENSRVNCFDWDETIRNIISEEATAYFQDRSSLEAVIAAIENRVEIYLAEKE